ncbi:MAG: S-layer homology domain-containing protein [Clostridia bacterium]|nr:S-layer homology domain-containing protein [Clostridia bacterium]
MCIGIQSFICIPNAVYADEMYGAELLGDTGFEDTTVGARPNNTNCKWVVYEDSNKSFIEFISDTENSDNVYDGSKAVRFLGLGGTSGMGMRYNSRSLISGASVGTTYEFSAYMKTNINSAEVNIETGDSSTEFTGGMSVQLTNEWQKVSAFYTITEENAGKPFSIILTTPLSTERQPSDYSVSGAVNKYNALRSDLSADEGQGFIYVDNVSFKTVERISVSDVRVSSVDGFESDSLVYAEYSYSGMEEEGDSEIQWQIADTKTSLTWETVKTVNSVTSASAAGLSMLCLDASMANKYLSALIIPKDISSMTGAQKRSEPVKIEMAGNLISNSEFKHGIFKWKGDVSYVEGENANGSMRIDGVASYPLISYNDESEMYSISFTAKGESLSIKGFGDEPVSFELTDDIKEYNEIISLDAMSDKDILFEGSCIIDNIGLYAAVPEAGDVKIENLPIIGSTVKASYQYISSVNAKEKDSVITWYVSDSKGGEKTELSNDKEIEITSDLEGKYLSFSVVPFDENGRGGTIVYSEEVNCYKLCASALKLKSTGNKTNDILYPSYSYEGTLGEGNTIIEWLMSDSDRAPSEAWEVINPRAVQERGCPKSNVNASTVEKDGVLLLSQDQRGKYVRFRITPVDTSGRKGVPVMSECTPVIEFERNMINNGDLSSNWDGWNQTYSNTFSNENSDLTGYDDGTGSLAVNAEAARHGYDISGGEFVTNRGYDTFSYYFANQIESKYTYDYAADIKLNYDHDTAMSISFMSQWSGNNGGYNFGQFDVYSNRWTHVTTSCAGYSNEDWARVTVRCQGSLTDPLIIRSGKYLIDNLTLYAKRPVVENLRISGNPKVGQMLSASYDYEKAFDLGTEYESEIKWLVSDYPWGPWEVKESLIGTSEDNYELEITNDMIGKYIRFSVTPQDLLLNKGLEMQTTKEFYVACSDDISKEIDGNIEDGNTVTARVKLVNSQKSKRRITAVLAIFKPEGGFKKLTNIAYETKSVEANGETELTPSLTADSADIGGEAYAFVFEGDKFTNLRPVESENSPGAGTGEAAANRAIVDNDKASVKVIAATEESNMAYSLVVINDNYSEITPDNIRDAVVYISNGTTGMQKCFEGNFSINGAAAGTSYTAYKTQSNGERDSSIKFRYNGSDAADKIAELIKNSTSEVLLRYFAKDRELYEGFDVPAVLSCDLTDYYMLENPTVVMDLLANKDFTKRTAEIHSIIENKADYEYKLQVKHNTIKSFKSDIQAGNPDNLRSILENYKDFFGFDLDNEYIFGYSYNSVNRKTVNTKILEKLQEAVNSTDNLDEIYDKVPKTFNYAAALWSINEGGWEDMENIVKANSGYLSVDVDSQYARLNAYPSKKTELNKAIYSKTFSSLEEFEKFLTEQIAALLNSSGGGGSPSSSSGSHASSASSAMAVTPAVKQPRNTPVFADIDSSHWAYDAVILCAEKGIVKGYDDNTIRPDNNITRAEFLTIILKTLNIETDAKEIPFRDVTDDSWYHDVVATAYEKGIVSGLSDTQFSPDSFITRQDMAAITGRALEYIKYSGTAIREAGSFADISDIADYAGTYVEKLYTYGVINGMDNNMFCPIINVNRAMAVQIAANLLTII